MAEWIKELLVGAFNMIYPANSIWKACMSCVKMMLVTTPIRSIGDKYPIHDIEIIEPDIEGIVRNLYESE